jgi:formate-dependent nitrite reductase membrane component NrfD
VPTIHKPHWGWLVTLYFYLGGLSAGSHVVASIAELVGGAPARPIVRVGRYLSFAALIPCPLLLVADLGRPERFLYMLRVLKLRSPMSVGVWGLLTFSAFCGVSTARQLARDGLLGTGLLGRLLLRLPGRVVDLLGSGPGFFVGSYTGVLLAATAVPLWTRSYLLMGPLFLTSAISNATAAIALLLALGRGNQRESLRRLQRLDTLALLGELALVLALRMHLGAHLARPLERNRIRVLFRGGIIGVGLVAPLAIQAALARLGHAAPRWLHVLPSVLVLIGGVLVRYVMVTAGRESADDPQATFEITRRRGVG